MELAADCECKELLSCRHHAIIDIPMIQTVIITVTLAKMNYRMLLK